MEFEVGDIVLVKGTITKVDREDSARTYRLTFSSGNGKLDGWVDTGNVMLMVDRPVPPEPLVVGDWVKSTAEPDLGPGEIKDIDSSAVPFYIKFVNGECRWTDRSKIEKTTKPVAAFAKGDKVIHINAPGWGVGVIHTVIYRDFDGTDVTSPGVECVVQKPGPYFTVLYPEGRTWSSVAEYLVKAKIQGEEEESNDCW